MGVKNLAKCSNVLSIAIQQQQQGFFRGLFGLSTIRNMGDYEKCRAPVKTKQEKKKCRMPEVIQPEYYKKPDPCKTDEELAVDRSLVHLRCDPPFKPLCMGPCFNEPRLDTKLYRPSKTLDKQYKKYWVDCIIEKPPKRPCIPIMPEIPRRKPRWTSCSPPPPAKGCQTIKPLLCRPLKPGPATSDTRCIKNPLCECPAARRITRCKAKQKTHCTGRRPLTRYPSFSECQSPHLNEAAKTECHHKNYSVCEMWRVFTRRRHG